MEYKYQPDDEDASEPMIHRATTRGDVATANRLLDADPTLITALSLLGNQPLHTACWHKQVELVNLLILRGADVNARGDCGETPLHYAVQYACPESNAIAELLVAAGADIEARDDRRNDNPLGFALNEFYDDVEPTIRLLLDHGSSIGLQSAIVLGDVGRVRQILSDTREPTSPELVRSALRLAEAAESHEIAGILAGWLKNT